MDGEQPMQSEEASIASSSKLSTPVIILIAVVATAIIVGGIVYAWQQSALTQAQSDLQQPGDSLPQAEQAMQDTHTEGSEGSTANEVVKGNTAAIPSSRAPELPVVVFQGDQFFTDAQKQILRERIVQPQIDYYNNFPLEDETNYLTAVIFNSPSFGRSPEYDQESEEYLGSYSYESVLATDVELHKKLYPKQTDFLEAHTNGRVIEKENLEDVEYWVPGCYAQCPFSDEFLEKYPHAGDIP